LAEIGQVLAGLGGTSHLAGRSFEANGHSVPEAQPFSLPPATVAVTGIDAAAGRVNVSTTGAAALFVHVTTAQQGQFDAGGFHLLRGASRTLTFRAWAEAGAFDPARFAASLHVQWLNRADDSRL
jgi:hypothetical protein